MGPGRAPSREAAPPRYDWVVVGAGPAGIAAVGKLLDNGLDPRSIKWIDPEFQVGDFGSRWRNVPSNTKVQMFLGFLKGCGSFDFDVRGSRLGTMDPQSTCILEDMAGPLRLVTRNLMAKVDVSRSSVLGVERASYGWKLVSTAGEVRSRNVVLAVGAEPRLLDYSKPWIRLEDVFDTARLASLVSSTDVVGVFGSSHSGVLSVKNLLEVGVGRIINFYRSPLRYAVDHGDWILYDNTGLKGDVAAWAAEEMGKVPAERLLRVRSTEASVGRYLPLCTKVVYGVGFESRKLRVEGLDPGYYDPATGVIGQGVFGCGIAFPERVVDRSGEDEYNVGLWKFIQYLDRVVPLWMELSGTAVKRARILSPS